MKKFEYDRFMEVIKDARHDIFYSVINPSNIDILNRFHAAVDDIKANEPPDASCKTSIQINLTTLGDGSVVVDSIVSRPK